MPTRPPAELPDADYHGDPTADAPSAMQLRQDRLIERFCAQARDALRSAPDEKSARALAEDLFEGFSGECASSLVVHATRSYVDRWISERWHGDPDDSAGGNDGLAD